MADTPISVTTDHHQPADTNVPLWALVVDDHTLVRSRVHFEPTTHAPDPDIIAKTDDVEDAIAAIHALRSDVVLFDVHLSGSNGGGGVEVTASCRDVSETCFLAPNVSDASDGVVGVIRAGVRGYVTRTVSTEDLAQAVWYVAAGDATFSPYLAGFVLDAFGAGASEIVVAGTELDRLLMREWGITRLIARGYAYKECAPELFISIRTIETHVSTALRKLQLFNRNELTRWVMVRHIV